MAEAGFYTKDGIQNSGTALMKDKKDTTIYMGKNEDIVYPRIQEKEIAGSKFGGFTLHTYRNSGYGTRSGVAYQGSKSNGNTRDKTKYHESWGHITPSKVPSISGFIEVTYVEAKFSPHACGAHSESRNLIFNVASNAVSGEPDLINGTTYSYTLAGGDDSKSSISISGSGANNNLCKLFTKLIKSGKELVLYNGETGFVTDPQYSDGTGYGSPDYAAIDSFSVTKIKVKYQP